MKTIIQFLQDNQIAFRENLPMCKRTTFRIGGNAALAIFPENAEDAVTLFRFFGENKIEYRIVGNGSNILMQDEGTDIPLLFTEKLKSYSVAGKFLTCSAGMLLSQAANLALEHSLAGLEFAHGIPGSVGGAVYMNAGAYGGEMKNAVYSSVVIDAGGEMRELSNAAHLFGYRKSILQQGGFLLSTTFQLQEGDPKQIKAKMTDYASRRKASQPLEYPSAGSVFKRPEGHYTGALIEQCGMKGYKIGGAQVSEKHAGFIVNAGGATAKDVKALVEKIQKTVFEQFGVRLETEIKYF